MNLWTKEIIAENLRDLPAGVREVCQSDGSCRHQPLPESSGRSRVEEVRLCDWAEMRLEWYVADGFHSRHGAEPGFL